MSLVLEMLHLNVPLSQWERHKEMRAAAGENEFRYFRSKNSDKVAQAIFAQMSHDKTIELLAKEFAHLPQDIRILLRTKCSEANASGNVRKGVQKLDKLMNGALLRQETRMDTFRTSTRNGFRDKIVRPEVAGATRKYGILEPNKKTGKNK